MDIQNIDKAKGKKDRAKREFWSLLMVIVPPLSLTLIITYSFGLGQKDNSLIKQFWLFPPLAVVHLSSVGSTLFMSLAAWLVWINGGFKLHSDALPLYLAHVSLSMVWCPLVLRIGVPWVGFGFSLVNLGTMYACFWEFGKVNPISKVFVVPCLAWVAYLTLITFGLAQL